MDGYEVTESGELLGVDFFSFCSLFLSKYIHNSFCKRKKNIYITSCVFLIKSKVNSFILNIPSY